MINKNLKTETAISKPLIITGFATILCIIALIIGFWLKSLSDNKELLDEMADETIEMRLISQLIFKIHQQTMALTALANTQSPDKKEESYNRFIRNRNTVYGLISKLSVSKMEALEQEIWSHTNSILLNFESIENNAIALYNKGKTQEAYGILINQVTAEKGQLLEQLPHLLDGLLSKSRGEILNIISSSESKNKTTYFLVILLGCAAVFLGVFTIIMVKKTSSTESQLIDQGKRIHLLYEATSNSGLSLDDRITETLKLGCRVLGMEIGKLGCQDPENNKSTFLNTIAPPELPAKRGLVLPLDKTFCNITFSTDGPIAIHHVSTSSYKDHPAAEFLGMEAYIGTTIYVHDKKFGTVNFSNRKPMLKPFTQSDIDFVNLLGKWISVTMEQIIVEEQLQKSKDEAESANQAKTTFLANMSHEIRTPLTAILGYSEMLLDEDQTQEDMEHEIDSIIASGSHLQKIINDILDLSKIEAGQLIIEYKKISPILFANDLRTLVGTRAEDKGLSFNIDFQFPLPKHINTDPTRLKQILINLCGNAIKFTHEGHITVSLAFLSAENQLEITVADSGIGISEEEQLKLFKPFSQADESTTRIYGGTGLGLCISKQLAHKLGGDISIVSEKGNGSQFITRIDSGISIDQIEFIEDTETNNQKLESITVANVSKLSGHILLVEDNIENQKLISKYVGKLGPSVDLAGNGQEAIDKTLAQKYDLILMDMQMPVLDGLEATRQLRISGDNTPIISLTANAMQEDRKKCIDAGANDYLSKPIDFNEFYSTLQKYLPG